MNGKMVINCPPMPVLATMVPWIRECQELFCPDNEIILDDGRKIPFVITFHKVKVRFQWPGHWLVDEVPATGKTQDGGRVELRMDKEHVRRTSLLTMDAQPCAATGTVELFGKTWAIGPRISASGEKLFFPVCTTTAVGLGFYKYIAEPVTAEGVVSEG